jgi:hypothetical protein
MSALLRERAELKHERKLGPFDSSGVASGVKSAEGLLVTTVPVRKGNIR